MILSVDVWLLPAIAAGSSSYLVCLIGEKFRLSRVFSSQPSAFSNSELGCRSRSSGTDASPSDRGNLPELKLGAQDSLSRPLNPCVMGFSP